MSNYPVRPEVLHLKPYVPGKPMTEVQREYGLTQVTKLASNENPLGPSPLAIEAMRSAAAEGHIYPESTAPALRLSLSQALGLPVDGIFAGNGSDEILRLLAGTYVRTGDRVVVPGCSFPNYRAVSELFGAVVTEVPLQQETMDLAAIAALAKGVRFVFLCSPNNPTGAVFGEAEFRTFMAAVPPQTFVLVDQAYYEYDDTAFDAVSLLHHYPNLILTRTFSKAYGLAGLRVGYGLAHPDLWQPLYLVREPFSINGIAQSAAIAALQDHDHLTRTRATNQVGKTLLYQVFADLRLPFIPTHANFVMFDAQRPAGPVFEALLRRGVIVRPCAGFGRPTWLRVTIGTPDQNEQFAVALREALAEDP